MLLYDGAVLLPCTLFLDARLDGGFSFVLAMAAMNTLGHGWWCSQFEQAQASRSRAQGG